MGKKLVIKGADFSEVAVGKHRVEHTCGELLTTHGNYGFTQSSDYQDLVLTESENWRTAILPIKSGMYIENATSINKEIADAKTLKISTPSIVFLSSDNIEDVIEGSEIYPNGAAGATFATFSGNVIPPENATHIIINANIASGYGGDLSSIISWMDDDE